MVTYLAEVARSAIVGGTRAGTQLEGPVAWYPGQEMLLAALPERRGMTFCANGPLCADYSEYPDRSPNGCAQLIFNNVPSATCE